jgi:Zn-dependent peptidase ImmA (M78 family)
MNYRELSLGIIKNARDFKKRLGISYDAPLDIESLLIDLDVVAVFRPMSADFSGMALKVKDKNFILINTMHSLGRQNFTICHELYHLFIQQDFSSMICDVGSFEKSNSIEFQADHFAAQMLIPHFGIIDFIPPDELRQDQITENTLLQIESYFKCSRKALLHTLKQMSFITETSFDKFLSNIKSGARKLGFETEIYSSTKESKVISKYAQLARSAYKKENISYTKLYNYMLKIGIDIEENIDENESAL